MYVTKNKSKMIAKLTDSKKILLGRSAHPQRKELKVTIPNSRGMEYVLAFFVRIWHNNHRAGN